MSSNNAFILGLVIGAIIMFVAAYWTQSEQEEKQQQEAAEEEASMQLENIGEGFADEFLTFAKNTGQINLSS